MMYSLIKKKRARLSTSSGQFSISATRNTSINQANPGITTARKERAQLSQGDDRASLKSMEYSTTDSIKDQKIIHQRNLELSREFGGESRRNSETTKEGRFSTSNDRSKKIKSLTSFQASNQTQCL